MNECLFSEDRVYRYYLKRTWGRNLDPTEDEGMAVFIGLNPSTADESKDDPTIRRCIGFAKEWGYSSLCMLNLFAYRATNPKNMLAHPFPIGALNDEVIEATIKQSDLVVAAWGNLGAHLNRDVDIKHMTRNLYHLGLTKSGQPKHPLYLPGNLKPELWASCD